jgi:uncharacterized protein
LTDSLHRVLRVALVVVVALAAAPVQAQALYDSFIRAVANDRVDEINALLARGIDPNTVDPAGDPVLLIATRSASDTTAGARARDQSNATIDALLKAGAKVDARNRFGDSPIMVAAIAGNLALVRKFYALGATINQPGWTPLLYAASTAQNDVIVYLLQVGAEIDAESPNGTTALMMAVRTGRLDTVELLLAKGATINHENQLGASALSWAQRAEFEEIAVLLRRKGAR